jgi:hypothetical protein
MSAMPTAAKNLVDQLSGLVLLAGGLDAQNRWWYSNASQIDTRRKKQRDDAKASGIDAFCPVMSASQTVWGCRRYVAVEAARGALNRISVATTKKPG